MQQEHLDEIIGAFVQAAEAKKGWETFEITCDKKVILSSHNTSFHSHGVKDLRDAAWNEICKLPWLSSSSDEGASDTVWGIKIIERLLRNSHRMTWRLKHRHADRAPFLIDDEYDIQDLLHAVLHGFF